MAQREIHNKLYPVVAFNTQTISTDTTTNGNILDTKDFDAIQFYVTSGTLTTGTFTVLIQEGDNSGLSDVANVADADLTTTEADASFAVSDDDEVKRIGYIGNKRYVRLSIVSASTANGVIGAIAIKGYPHVGKVSGN